MYVHKYSGMLEAGSPGIQEPVFTKMGVLRIVKLKMLVNLNYTFGNLALIVDILGELLRN